MKPVLEIVAILIAIFLTSSHAADLPFSQTDSEIGRCNRVLKEISSIPEIRIPKELFQRASGLAIFPGVINVGAVVGFELGKGIILRRDDKTLNWSNPAFFTFRSGSVGFQFGAQSIDLILLFVDETGIQRLLEEKLILGVDASVSAGPLGRDTSMDTNLSLESQILSYSRARGLFAGVSVTGGMIQPDKLANEAFHGKEVSVQDVLYENKGTQSDNTRNLLETINDISK
jgi:lipid-binding SYLF domain-containing protein